MLPLEVLKLLRQLWKTRPTAYNNGVAPEQRWLEMVAEVQAEPERMRVITVLEIAAAVAVTATVV
jgi:hypothetical protein